MLKLLGMLFKYIWNSIFTGKDEGNIKSHKFNAQKMMLFIIVTLSIALNYMSIKRLYSLAEEYRELENKICVKTNASDPSDSAKNSKTTIQ